MATKLLVINRNIVTEPKFKVVKEKRNFKIDYNAGKDREKQYRKEFHRMFYIWLDYTPPLYFADFIYEPKKIMFELKTKKYMSTKMKTIIVPIHKIVRYEQFNKKNGGKYKFIIIARFSDKTVFHEHINGAWYNTEVITRHDYLSGMDVRHRYVHFEISKMEPHENMIRFFLKK